MKNPKDSKLKLKDLVNRLNLITNTEKYKNKNKYIEIKIDKLFKLLKQHAFDPDTIPDEVGEKFDAQMALTKLENGKGTKEGIRGKQKFTIIKFILCIEFGSDQQIEAIRAMYIKLETDIEGIKERAKESDYATQIVEESSLKIAQGEKPDPVDLKGKREKDINRIMNVEFMGMKQLIGKHQLSLNRIDKYLRDIEEYKNQSDLLDKVNLEQKKQSDEIKVLIKEMNEYHSSLITKMQGKLHSKPDFEILEGFQKNINEKVLDLLVQKIDRDDHKRFQMRMTKKLNNLEKEVGTKHNQDEYKPPFVVSNNK
jgi:hypothetical protein